MDERAGVHDRPPTEAARRWWVGICTCRAIEVTAAGVVAVWGWLLASPAPVFLSTTAYATFRLLGLSEAAWGILFLAVALTLSGGVATGRRRLRMLGLAGAAGVFAFVAILLAVGNPVGFGWAGNAGYVGLCLFALRRLDW